MKVVKHFEPKGKQSDVFGDSKTAENIADIIKWLVPHKVLGRVLAISMLLRLF
jgi:hypothetical protein